MNQENAYQQPMTNITSESSINSSIQKKSDYKNIDPQQQQQSNHIQKNQNKQFLNKNNEMKNDNYDLKNQQNAKGSIDFHIGVNQQNIFNYVDRNESLEISSITQQDPSFLTKQSYPFQINQTNQSGYNHITSKQSSKDREQLDENDPEESRPNRPNIVQSSIEIIKPAFNFQNEINLNVKTKSTKNKNYQSQNQNFIKNEGKNYLSAIPNKIEQIRKIQNTQQIIQKDQFQFFQNQLQSKDNSNSGIEIQTKQISMDKSKKAPRQKTGKTMSENWEIANNLIESKKQEQQEKLSQMSNQTAQPMFKQQSKLVINNSGSIQSRLQSASHISVNRLYNNQKNISIQKKRHRSTSNGINQSYQSGKTATFIEHSIQSQSNFQRMQQQLNNNLNYQQSSLNNSNVVSSLVTHPVKQSKKSISIMNNQLNQRGKDKKNSISPTFFKQAESATNKLKNNFIQQVYKIQSLSPVELSIKNGGLGNKNFRISSQKDHQHIQSQHQILDNNEKREQLIKQLNQNQTSKSLKKTGIQTNCIDQKQKQLEMQNRIYSAQEQRIQRKNQISINGSSLHTKIGSKKSQEHIIKPNTNKIQISSSDINQKLERYTASFGEQAISQNLADKNSQNPYNLSEFQKQYSNQNINSLLIQNQINNGTKIIRPKTNTANSTVSSIQTPIDSFKADSKNSIVQKKNNNSTFIQKQQQKKEVTAVQPEFKKQERQQSFRNAPQKIQQKQEQILIKRGVARQSNSHKISPKHSSSVVLFKQEDTISQVQDELIVDQNATTPLSDINPLNNYSNLNFASQQTPNMNYINDQHQNTSVSMWSSNQQQAPTHDDQIQQMNQQLPKFFINKNTSATNQSVLSNHSKLSNNLKQNKQSDALIYMINDKKIESKVNTTELAEYNQENKEQSSGKDEFIKLQGINDSNKSFNDEISKLKVNNLMNNYDGKSNDQSQISKDIEQSEKEDNNQLFSKILKNLNIFDENSIQQINNNPEIILNIQQQIKDIISKQLQISKDNDDQSTDLSQVVNKTSMLNESLYEQNKPNFENKIQKQDIIQRTLKSKHSQPVSPKSKNQIKINKDQQVDKKSVQRLVDLSQIDKSITEISDNKKNINNSNKKQANEDINKYASNQQQQNSFQINESEKVEEQKEMKNNCYIKKNTVTKYAFATRVGYIPMNPSKVNQDSYILSPCIESFKKNYRHMFGVCDGHGQFGHQVSAYIKDHLPKIVKDLITQKLDDSKIPNYVTTNDTYTFLNKEYENLLQSSFLKCDQNMSYQLQNSSKENHDSKSEQIDLRLSGSTVCTVCFDGTSIHCANAGDSRAIIATVIEDTEGNLKVTVTPLSEDHKPDLIEEQKRILGMGGRIDTFHDTLNNNEPIGPYRVWLKDQEMPGLAMSRSLGDQIAHSVGVSSLPEIKSRYIGINDKFVVIGSDGVWEFLSNQDVAEVVLPFYKINQPESAANAIVKAAHQRWREEEEVVDDITAVVIFMEPIMAFQEQNQEQTKIEKTQKEKVGGYFCQKSNSVPVINQ